MENYIVYHLHDDTSNCNGYSDSCTSYKDYIKLAKKQNMKAIAFSNHGGIYNWVKKKQDCDKVGIKYIHGIELYLCTKLENDERGYHIGLYAKNLDGVKELNTLISLSSSKGTKEDKTDRHFYYNPRISIEELMNTSDNILVISSCLASILWKKTIESIEVLKNESLEELEKQRISEEHLYYRTLFLNWLSQNNHRCFLEIQYHNCESQKEYNKLLYEWSKEYNLPLIAGTDTHSLNEYKAECRKILQKSKNSYYGEEDEFDLTWKTLDELIKCFKNQNALSEDIYLQAIQNTNTFADLCEDFKLDKTFKYPNLYGDNVNELFKNKIMQKYNHKTKNGIIDKNNPKYKQYIQEEFTAFQKQGMESFLLFMSELIDYCNDNNIPYGFCRGSVGGSTIAYILDIIDLDPIKWDTVFSRFCNADRISLGDIDVDFAPKDREKVYEYIINKFGANKTSYIAQFGTLQDRGTIDVLTKGLDYENLDEVANIKNEFEKIYKEYSDIIQSEVNIEELDLEKSTIDFDNHDIYINQIRNTKALKKANKLYQSFQDLKNNNKDLFFYFDGLKGTIISKGHHPCGMIGSPITLQDNLGVFYSGGEENFPVSTCAMKAVDSLNYVKFDILGLKTVGIMKDTYKYINSHYLKSYEIDWEDKKVWDDMIKSKIGVFQFEGDFAFALLKEFKPQKINDMSLVNASLRPSGKSYRDRLIAREINKNPSEEIDNLLRQNNGFLVYQEDTIKFLTDICGFNGSLADTTRRCVDENTLILMGNGNRKKIKDIKVNDYVVSINKNNITEPKKVINVFNNGIQKTYKIYTQHNNYITATENHKILTQDGWKKIKDLTINDWVMTPKKLNSLTDNILSKYKPSEETMFLLGLLIGDGSIGNINSIHFTNSEELLINKYKKCVNQLLRRKNECKFKIFKQNGVNVDYIYNVYIDSLKYNNQLKQLLLKYNLNCFAGDKKIPDDFMLYPIGGKLTHLLAGLFNTDGGYNLINNTIEYYTKSKILAYQIKSLLMKYDIYSYVESKKVKGYDYNYYTVTINQKDSIIKFGEKIIPFVIGRKKDDYNNVVNESIINKGRYNYLLPQKYYNEIIKSANNYGFSFSDIGNKIGGYKYNGFKLSKDSDITDIKAKNIIQYTYCPDTYQLLMSEYFPLKITNIIESEDRYVYDIEVEENHNYIANELIVHNCIGKKDVELLKEQLPKILEGYCRVSNQPREKAEEEAKAFLQIIEDSSEYQFGYNHSTGYSMNGYACTRLRTYYPLEFITAYLNNAANKEDIQMGTELAKEKDIKIKSIEFGQSIDEYTFNKETNTIYKGIESIKFCNSKIATELYKLRDNKYNTFAELLVDINSKTSVDARQLKILTGLNFFKKFGKNKKLLQYIDIFNNFNSRKQIKKSELEKFGLTESLIKKYSNKETEALYKELNNIGLISELTSKLEDKTLSVKEQVKFEKDFLEYVIYINQKAGNKFYIVIEYTTYNDKRKPYVTLRHIQTGEEIKTKVKDPQLFIENPFELYSVLKVNEFKQQFKTKNIGGQWRKTDELEDILFNWEVY